MSKLEITSIKISVLPNPVRNTLGYARIVIADQIIFDCIRIFIGANGLSVAYPNDNNSENARPYCYPITKELRDNIENSIITEFKNIVKTEFIKFSKNN
jgi:DNA-binding cell septation regulator SpoVG